QLNGTIPDVGAMQAIFSSFSDAPDGFSEELREFNISAGVEYMYENLLALRGGYFFEPISKGGRKYFTTGLGFRLKENYGLDLAYLIPTTSGSPLANTWRLSFIFDLKGKLSNSPSDDIIREE
ncbi:MAG: PorV/PorQ family protein, partial [Spirosomataceae bacterium]